MPVFEYTALNKKGKNISGVIDADSAMVARQKLRTSNQYPITLKEVMDTPLKKESKGVSFTGRLTRIKQRDVTMMTRQLATLVGAGFPLVSAIEALTPSTKSISFNKVLAQIKDSIVEGNSFANSLAMYPDTFSPLYVNMIRAGESSGTLEIVLEQLADISEKQQDLKSRIQAAMAYPILMACIGILILSFLLAVVVPKFTAIFSDMNQVLPTPTRILIQFSDLFKSYWWFLLICVVGIGFIFKKFKKTTKGEFLVDKIKLGMPIFGQLVQKLSVARFSRTLGSLLENGVSMLQSLDIAKNISGNVLVSTAVEEAAKEVGQGQGLGASLSVSKIFPHLSIQMIQVGEQSGKLEPMLKKMADVFEKEAEAKIMSLTALLGPVMILIMGGIVLFIVLSICLPIFEMTQLVR